MLHLKKQVCTAKYHQKVADKWFPLVCTDKCVDYCEHGEKHLLPGESDTKGCERFTCNSDFSVEGAG